MKPLTGLWEKVLAWDNLLFAYRRARRGKRNQPAVQQFGFDLEYELAELRQSLGSHAYQPGSYRQFTVRDRKVRLISAAPFRDRVVQHALMNVVEPLLDRRFISDSYASRRGKGVHAAMRRYRLWAGRYDYALKLDIQRYFDSIDHRLLEGKIARHLGDAELRWLFQTIIASSPEPLHPCVVPAADEDLVDLMERRIGLPLRNLISQFLGNLYLDDLDHYVKETLRVPAYLRYVDDLVLLGNDKAELWEWCRAIEHFLSGQRLRVHPRKRLLTQVHCGLDVLGYRADRRSTRLGRGSGYRFRRRLRHWSRQYAAGRIPLGDVRTHIAGWMGHACQADTRGLRRAVLSGISFVRGGSAGRWPGGSRRFVEQQPTEPAIGQPQQEQDR